MSVPSKRPHSSLLPLSFSKHSFFQTHASTSSASSAASATSTKDKPSLLHCSAFNKPNLNVPKASLPQQTQPFKPTSDSHSQRQRNPHRLHHEPVLTVTRVTEHTQSQTQRFDTENAGSRLSSVSTTATDKSNTSSCYQSGSACAVAGTSTGTSKDMDLGGQESSTFAPLRCQTGQMSGINRVRMVPRGRDRHNSLITYADCRSSGLSGKPGDQCQSPICQELIDLQLLQYREDALQAKNENKNAHGERVAQNLNTINDANYANYGHGRPGNPIARLFEMQERSSRGFCAANRFGNGNDNFLGNGFRSLRLAEVDEEFDRPRSTASMSSAPVAAMI